MSNQEGKPIFDTWMMKESDNIQALATAYGENLAIREFTKILATCNEGLRPKLTELFQLYALDRIMGDGVFFLTNGFMSAEQSQKATNEIQRLCSELGKDALELTKGFGIPDHMHHAPIANNWVKYNEIENAGELKVEYRGREALLSRL